jgi:hypothetical protein
VRSGPNHPISQQPRPQGPHKAASSRSSRCRLAAPARFLKQNRAGSARFQGRRGPKPQFVMWAVWTAWLNIAFSESVICCGVVAV